jgi:glycosyltransferase involved in cell wall biosynthesis
MQTVPSISVVIPNYNGSEILIETIRCAIKALETSQITDYEIIVSDDASKDDSIEVIKANFNEKFVFKSNLNFNPFIPIKFGYKMKNGHFRVN